MDQPTAAINASDYFDPASPTSGLERAVAALPPEGGQVQLQAGTYWLRRSLYIPSRVRLVGQGPASILAIHPLSTIALARDHRRGSRTVHCAGKVPFAVGDEIGLNDDKMHGWWGTHALIEAIDGPRMRLSRPLEKPLKKDRNARAVSLFPALHAFDENEIHIRDLAIAGPPDFQGEWWDFTYAAIHLNQCHRSQVSGCHINNWPSDGIGVQRGGDIQVTHCQAHACRGHGFHPGTGLQRSVWSHNIGRRNGGDGLYFCARVHHSICSDSVFDSNGLNGIGGVANGGDRFNIIDSNICTLNARCGIDANRGEEQVITGNIVLNNSQQERGRWPAIKLHDLQRALVQGNRCTDDQEHSTQRRGIIESGASDYNLVSGNLCVGTEEPIVLQGRHSRAEGNLV
ncbi:MAG: hypothetical protein GKR89_07625 [Candidatus Latescibacteria bacterium]|nr:hypothetical protein [Candidatus Latescibacterota bacterium]